jgi:hypothetical protein
MILNADHRLGGTAHVYGHFIIPNGSTVVSGRNGATELEWRHRMRLILTIAFTLCLATGASAQQPPPPTDQPPPYAIESAEPPPAAGQPGAARRQPNAKRVACRNKAQQQGLRGPQVRDAMALCVEEARLACTKQAIAQKLAGPQRRDFMKNCAG